MRPDKQQLLASAEAALQSLYDARNKLEDARGLGVWDMFGGGMFSSMLKHDRLKEADLYLAEAQDRLQKLLHNLEAWPEQIYVPSLDVGENQKFFDIFLDNIFTDVKVQDKIRTAQEQLDQVIYQVQNLLAVIKKL